VYFLYGGEKYKMLSLLPWRNQNLKRSRVHNFVLVHPVDVSHVEQQHCEQRLALRAARPRVLGLCQRRQQQKKRLHRRLCSRTEAPANVVGVGVLHHDGEVVAVGVVIVVVVVIIVVIIVIVVAVDEAHDDLS
jgi:hypothetical protein